MLNKQQMIEFQQSGFSKENSFPAMATPRDQMNNIIAHRASLAAVYGDPYVDITPFDIPEVYYYVTGETPIVDSPHLVDNNSVREFEILVEDLEANGFRVFCPQTKTTWLSDCVVRVVWG